MISPLPPPAYPGERIGLFGGSFNPVHDGHRLVAAETLRRLRLDRMWILVSPGNPLKDRTGLPSLADRMAAARAAFTDPRMTVTGFEAARGLGYSWQTIAYLTAAQAGTHFVFVIGADNLRDLHRWQRWQDLVARVPLAVYARPGAEHTALASPAATALARFRLDERDAPLLATRRAPAWVYLHGRRSPLSSTALRARRAAR